jgi:hypothetical protein
VGMFRVSIRDLLWLMLTVSLCVAWLREQHLHRASVAKHQALESQLTIQEIFQQQTTNL